MPEPSQVDWRSVVEQIQARNPAGEEALYQALNSGARQFFRRRLGIQDVEDRVHDLFLIVVQAILRGEIRQPERLMGFVRTVLYRQLNLGVSRIASERKTSADPEVVAHLSDSDPDPEQQVLSHERVESVAQELRKLKTKDFEILTRYYLREQQPERICEEMALSQTQFILRKSRAKARFAGVLRRNAARAFNQQ